MAKKFLTNKNIPFNEIPVDGNSDKRKEMTQKAEGRTSVPQIFIDDIPIGGFDDIYRLEQQGKLDELL